MICNRHFKSKAANENLDLKSFFEIQTKSLKIAAVDFIKLGSGSDLVVLPGNELLYTFFKDFI